MTKESFYSHWQQRTAQDSFSERLNKLWHDSVNDFLDKRTDELLHRAQDIENASEEAWQSQAGDTWAPRILDLWQKRIFPIIKEEGEKLPKPLKDMVSAESYQAWQEVYGQPIQWDKDMVEEAVNHPAIKEMFVDVIQEAIISFNKKYNPFFGAASAFGIEKQIREFLVIFMDSAINMVSNFLTSEKNQDLIAQFNQQIYQLAMEQKPSFYLNAFPPEGQGRAMEAMGTTSQDQTLSRNLLSFAQTVQKRLSQDFGDKTLRELLEQNGDKVVVPDLPFTIRQNIQDYLGQEPFGRFLAEEFASYQAKGV